MKSGRRMFGWFASLVLGLCLLAGGRLEAAESFDWKPNSVAAEISSWDLPKLLQKLVEATGWPLAVSGDLRTTDPPSALELDHLRRLEAAKP